jgi:hypothetical protein
VGRKNWERKTQEKGTIRGHPVKGERTKGEGNGIREKNKTKGNKDRQELVRNGGREGMDSTISICHSRQKKS